ncbi:MAG: SDR family oxidoreductase [Acidimicrobiales bacterium]|jgi:NAD(P)-dependent dehydrogenase (short-subunit alcohol dehydrogenase family)|nr:SDR family oxidoreductase [Acidimicrobiales bacterium]
MAGRGVAGPRALIVGAGDPASSVAAGLDARGWAVQHLDDDSIEWTDATVDQHAAPGGIDLVVHARYPAASRRKADLVSLSAVDWHAAADEPLEAAIRLARGAHPRLAEAGGTIVFLVPLMASAGGEGFAPLATAAEGSRLLAKSLAKTWGGDGIRAHALTLDPSAFLDADDAAGMAEANALHDPPLGHVPDLSSEITPIVDALTTGDLAALTGASLVADGGLWMPG